MRRRSAWRIWSRIRRALLAYDALVGSWGGVLNESVIMISIVISILCFGWNSMDGDKIGEK